MEILVAFEESGKVTKAFRDIGHRAFSCDILPTRGNDAWHLKMDVREVLVRNNWDLIIAFPPCTDLAVSGARWFPEKIESGDQQRSIDMFMLVANFGGCGKIAVENPIGIMSRIYRKPDQIIQPWQFGHKKVKSTCLWLKGLPNLKPTRVVGPPPDDAEQKKSWQDVWRCPPGPLRSRIRSETYTGIANAMARQWG